MKTAAWLLIAALCAGLGPAIRSGAQPPVGRPALPVLPVPLPPPKETPPAPPPPAVTATGAAPAAVAAAPAAGEGLRNPFWPLGYTPGSAKAVAPPLTAAAAHPNEPPAVNGLALARSEIHVQGYVRQGAQTLVMINGHLTGVGDNIRIQSQGRTWRFVVRRIQERDVTIEPVP